MALNYQPPDNRNKFWRTFGITIISILGMLVLGFLILLGTCVLMR
jgi:hypothetical protein